MKLRKPVKTPLFKQENWGNQYSEGIAWEFLWGKIILEYEFSNSRGFAPSLLYQWGGDALLTKSLSLFGRTLSLIVVPLA